MDLAMIIATATPLVTQPVAIFLVVLAIILLAPLLLNPLKIPNIIGLIIAGVAVGPYGFNLVARDMSFEVFGQVGILYLMFLAGLEIDMYHLKKNLGKGLVFGAYTFLLPLVGGLLAGHYLLHLPWLASMLVAAMFAAHTLIGYPIISRFGLTKSPAVIIAIAGTIITVLGSLVVLASVVGGYHDGEFAVGSTLRLLGELTVYCVVIAYIYPRLSRWFFKTYIDPIQQFIFVLAMAFLAAVAAMAIGIEGVFGAFYAGLTLNRYIPSKSSLMSRIEFAGNAIFIPYFLIGVGMLINVKVITTGWGTLYVAAVMSVAAIACKWIAAFLAQVTFKMGRIDRSIMYQLSNAHTAVALAVVMIGYNLGVFDDDILNGTVLMILVTCTVASLGVERAAGRLARNVQHAAALDHHPLHESSHTLVSLAGPSTAKQLVKLAILMRGATRSIDSKLYALHVRNDNTPSSRAIGRNALDIAEQYATSTNTRLVPIERYDLNVVTGVLNTIAERDISTIIIGLHRRGGIIDSFYGSKIEQLLRTTNRMVVMSRTFIPLNTVTRILVVVPDKAQAETGFATWVEAVGNLTRQIGCSVTFLCSDDTRKAITSVLYHGKFEIRYFFKKFDNSDDYVLLSNKVEDDDLLIFVSARRSSVSFSPVLDDMTQFIQRYFAENNLIVLYPEQFGNVPDIPTMAETMTPDMVSTPSLLWMKLQSLLRRK